MFSFLLLINLIPSQPQDVSSQEEKCVTTAIVEGEYAGITTYCPDFDPACRNRSPITVPENSACITECASHSGGTWCLVDDSRWSFCKNQSPHPCPETCKMGFDAGQECADGYRRGTSLDDEFCSTDDPPSGACDFSGNEDHMQNCCMLDPTASPSISSPSNAPSPQPTTSAPTTSPFTSFPTSLPTIDCTAFEEPDTCDPTLGCVFVGETCEHTCPKWAGMSPPQSWITDAHEITILPSGDLPQCDFECRTDPTCSVFISDVQEKVCVLYDTHMPEDVALVENENVTTGLCHTTLAPSQAPSASPTLLPSETPSALPSKVPSQRQTCAVDADCSISDDPSTETFYCDSTGRCRDLLEDTEYCANSGACGLYDGNCDVDEDCAPGLMCEQNTWAQYHPTVLGHNNGTNTGVCVFTVCPFEGEDADLCDAYCTDVCYFTPECRDFILGAPVELSQERRYLFESGKDSAPEDWFSPAVAKVDGQACSCKTMTNKPIPGMDNSTCLMSTEIKANNEGADDDEEEGRSAWVAVGVMSFILCCILPLLLLLCCAGKKDEDEEQDSKEEILLGDSNSAIPVINGEHQSEKREPSKSRSGGGDVSDVER